MGDRVANENEESQPTEENQKLPPKHWLKRIQAIYKWNQRFNYTLGLKGILIGAIYIDSAEEECPWSPLLLPFLLTFGIFNIIAVLTFRFIKALRHRLTVTKKTKMWLRIMILAVNIGLTAWGFVLLYSNKEEVTFRQCSSHNDTTVMNENYCERSVYLVPRIVTWASAVACIMMVLALYVGLRSFLRELLAEEKS